MSVSLVLIPVALAIRGIMGKDKFNKMVESSQIKIETNFENKEDLISTVIKAGFDAKKFGYDVIKTHLNGKKEFFFWEKINGKWIAEFSIYDSKERVINFIKKLEISSGRKIFIRNLSENQSSTFSKSYATNFKDENILIKTLEDYGVNYSKQSNGDILCKIDHFEFEFKLDGNSSYLIEFKDENNSKEMFQNLTELDEGYKRNVQNKTYENLKIKIKEKGYNVESEEIMEDNSIVITVNV